MRVGGNRGRAQLGTEHALVTAGAARGSEDRATGPGRATGMASTGAICWLRSGLEDPPAPTPHWQVSPDAGE
jgi:hypothetical protein